MNQSSTRYYFKKYMNEKKKNKKLTDLLTYTLQFLDSTTRQDICNRECPAYQLCKGESMCQFLNWVTLEAKKLNITID